MDCVRKRQGYEVYYLFKNVNKRRLSICLKTSDKREADKKARLLIQAAEDKRWDIIEAAMSRKVLGSSATIDQICESYLQVVERIQRPAEWVARRNVWVLKRIISIAGYDGESHDARILDGDLVIKFTKAMLDGKDGPALRSAQRSVISYLRQARSLFTPALMEEYRALKLPDLTSFRNRLGTVAPAVEDKPYSQEEVEVIRSGSELKNTMAGLYPVWFLGYYAGLRAGEIAQAKKSWIRKYMVTEQDRVSGEWLRGREFVWVLDLNDPDAQLKTANSRGMVPLADDVATELQALVGDREYIVPGNTESDRRNMVNRQFGLWLKGKGWQRRSKVQEFRRYRYQVWTRMYGRLYGEMWCRRSIQGVSRFYDSALYLSRRPLGLEE